MSEDQYGYDGKVVLTPFKDKNGIDHLAQFKLKLIDERFVEPSSMSEDERLDKIKAAIGWANPNHRIRDVKNLLEDADMNGYKRGFKEAESMYRTPKTEVLEAKIARLKADIAYAIGHAQGVGHPNKYLEKQYHELVNQPSSLTERED